MGKVYFMLLLDWSKEYQWGNNRLHELPLWYGLFTKKCASMPIFKDGSQVSRLSLSLSLAHTSVCLPRATMLCYMIIEIYV